MIDREIFLILRYRRAETPPASGVSGVAGLAIINLWDEHPMSTLGGFYALCFIAHRILCASAGPEGNP